MKKLSLLCELKVDAKTKSRLGQCYALSWRKVLDSPWDDNTFLIHGHIKNRFKVGLPELDHAWVEKGNEVWEPITDKWWDKKIYYELFNATVNGKYDKEVAMLTGARTGNYGPWQPNEVAKPKKRP